MRRFFLQELDSGSLIGEEAHHCAVVLRAEPGDRVVLFDGQGTEVMATLTDVTAKHVRFREDSRTKTPRGAGDITLVQALPKNKSMDLIVQKATELGVSRIQPLISERSVVRLDEEQGAQKAEKWKQIAVEAAKQCGQNWLPEILPARSAREFLMQKPLAQAPFIGSLQPGARTFRRWLKELRGQSGVSKLSYAICIGPEGDFSPAEISTALASGYLPVTLGPVVLRSETAAIFSLSVLSYESQD